MAVISSVRRRSRESGSSADEKRRGDVYRITVQDGDGADVARDYSGLPAIGSRDGAYYCTDKDAQEVDGGNNVYDVTVTFSTKWGGGNSPDTPEYENPTDKPAEFEMDFAVTSEEIDKDINGNPIQNTAGTAFTGITEDFYDLVLIFKKNVVEFDFDFASDMIGSVNSSSFSIRGGTFPAGSAKITRFNGREAFENGFTYVSVTLEITIRKDDIGLYWKRRVRNLGMYDANGSRIVDGDNEPVVEPVDLAQDGSKNTGTPIFLEFETKKQRDFNLLAPYTE